MNKISIVFVILTILIAAGCSDDTQAGQGTEGGFCFPDNTCNPGLICTAGVCVKIPDGTINIYDSGTDSLVSESILPDTELPDTQQPDTLQPDILLSDNSIPDTTKDSLVVDTSSQPDVLVPDTTKDSLVVDTSSQPDIFTPDTTKDSLVVDTSSQPDVLIPDTTKDSLIVDTLQPDAPLPPPTWANSFGSTSNDDGWAIALDTSNNIYVTGRFYSQMKVGTTTLTSRGSSDMFLIKLSSSGQPLWGVSAGDTSGDYGYSVVVDNNDNVYVAGSFSQNAIFNTTTLTSKGLSDIFVAKYSRNGQLYWVAPAGGTGTDTGYGITLDAYEDPYVTGRFYGLAYFGTIRAQSHGNSDIFVSKLLRTDGSVLWVSSAGGASTDTGKSIGVDRSGNAYVTGSFYDVATFGAVSRTSNGSADIFLAKYSNLGVFQWVVTAGGTNYDTGLGITLDTSNNIYVAGYFYGQVNFWTTTLTSNGSYDAFVIKLSSTPSLSWVQKAGGVSVDQGYGIAVDSTGNAYLAGSFQSQAYNLISKGGDDAFIATFNKNGSLSWGQSAGGTKTDKAYGIAVDSTGNPYVVGTFQDQAYFGITTLSSQGITDVFVWKPLLP